jgi:hypothetical protein
MYVLDALGHAELRDMQVISLAERQKWCMHLVILILCYTFTWEVTRIDMFLPVSRNVCLEYRPNNVLFLIYM